MKRTNHLESSSLFERAGYFVGRHATAKVLAALLLGAIAGTLWVASGPKVAGEPLHTYPDPSKVDQAAAWLDAPADANQVGGRPGATVQLKAGDHSVAVIVDPSDVKVIEMIKSTIATGLDRQKGAEREHGIKAPTLNLADQRAAMEALAAGMGQDGR